MPRAAGFLIRHRTFSASPAPAPDDNAAETIDYSTDNRFNINESPWRKKTSSATAGSAATPSASHYISDYTNDNSNCPEELYNLKKLAEVSLAVASGRLTSRTIISSSNNSSSESSTAGSCEENTDLYYNYAHKIFDRRRAGLLIQDKDQAPMNLQRRCSSTSVIEAAEASDLHSCPDCGKRYSTSSNLARHRQTHRSLADKKARHCPHCEKIYVSMPAFSMHVRTHNQGCKCQYCGKCFSRPWLLQGHIRTHTGEKPFCCSICNKAFADKSNLRAHIQTHSNTKPHICGRCGKAFALKSYLYKHEESSCMRLHTSSNSKIKIKHESPHSDNEVIHRRNSVFIHKSASFDLRSATSTVIKEPAVSLLYNRTCTGYSQDQPMDFSYTAGVFNSEDKVLVQGGVPISV